MEGWQIPLPRVTTLSLPAALMMAGLVRTPLNRIDLRYKHLARLFYKRVGGLLRPFLEYEEDSEQRMKMWRATSP